MRHIFQWDFLLEKEHLRSQDDEALIGYLPWEMDINAYPDSGRLGAVSVPWITRAKDHWFKTSNLSSQEIFKSLCKVFLKWQQTIESVGKKANRSIWLKAS